MNESLINTQTAKPKSAFNSFLSRYKSTILYTLCFIVSFTLWFVFLDGSFKKSLNQFVIGQIGFLIFGVIHAILIYKMLSWTLIKNLNPWKEIIFTLALAAIAIGLGYLTRKGFQISEKDLLPLSCVPFLIPFLLLIAWDFWEAIPAKDYLKWEYPVGLKPPFIQPQKNPLILNFKIDLIKEGLDFKEPFAYEMDGDKSLGDHMHFYIYHHNQKYTGEKTILISDPKNNIPYGWIFCTYNFIGIQRVLDFRVPIKELKLKQGSTIEVQNL